MLRSLLGRLLLAPWNRRSFFYGACFLWATVFSSVRSADSGCQPSGSRYRPGPFPQPQSDTLVLPARPSRATAFLDGYPLAWRPRRSSPGTSAGALSILSVWELLAWGVTLTAVGLPGGAPLARSHAAHGRVVQPAAARERAALPHAGGATASAFCTYDAPLPWSILPGVGSATGRPSWSGPISSVCSPWRCAAISRPIGARGAKGDLGGLDDAGPADRPDGRGRLHALSLPGRSTSCRGRAWRSPQCLGRAMELQGSVRRCQAGRRERRRGSPQVNAALQAEIDERARAEQRARPVLRHVGRDALHRRLRRLVQAPQPVLGERPRLDAARS